ncbi:DUF6461 domain-containing protein [Microtetraspora fusca]|uniref:DUF6461 domain-containing protein n=1 Tax=Microtetraspora fusca TaxID=1997 RepID=A0ABW6VBW8_MICFU
MTATAADYTWFRERFAYLAEAYCFTLIRGLTFEELVDRLGARTEEFPNMTFEELVDSSFSGPGAYGTWDGHFFGVVPVGDWILIVEPSGFLGVTREAIVPLSAGTRLVSHFRNVNSVNYFYWVEDGDIRLFFEPLSPSPRDGSDPDGLVEIMQQAGFDLRNGGNHNLFIGAAFALAEHLTGIKVTPQLLEKSIYSCGVAPGS